jgi:hypothetical protein
LRQEAILLSELAGKDPDNFLQMMAHLLTRKPNNDQPKHGRTPEEWEVFLQAKQEAIRELNLPLGARLPYDGQFGPKCGGCTAKVGEPHEPGCDLEDCAVCGGQAISCGCPAYWEQRAQTPQAAELRDSLGQIGFTIQKPGDYRQD